MNKSVYGISDNCGKDSYSERDIVPFFKIKEVCFHFGLKLKNVSCFKTNLR